jgi:hypothetical protein
MKTNLKLGLILATLATTLALAAPAGAQEVTKLPDDKQQSVGLQGGLDAAFIARATYVHRVDLGFLRDARTYWRFTLPFLALDPGQWALDGGLQATPLAWGDLRLALLVGPVVRNSVNALFSSTALGADATILFGYEGPRWGLSAEAGYEQIFAAYLQQSAVYRETFYAGAKDGLYATPGSTARAGLRGGARFGSFEIAASGGVDATGQFHALMPPFYGTLGGSFAF